MLFEAYTRLGPPKGSSGLGLGLFVAREIVAAHGGTITVTSQIGSGSTFTVRLPAPPAACAGLHGRGEDDVVTIRLAIVEDHPALADGLAALLRGSPDVEVVGTAPDVSGGDRPARARIARHRPVRHPPGTGRRRVRPRPPLRAEPGIHHADGGEPIRAIHARAVDLGARGYLSKMASVDQILDAIRTVAAGGSAYPSDARRSAKDALRIPTPRELEILALVAEGDSNVEIADRLSLRVKTVESQLRRLFDRYDVTSRTALARLAIRQGWIVEEE